MQLIIASSRCSSKPTTTSSQPTITGTPRAPEILIIIQSVAVYADIKLNVLDSFSRKELLRLATVVSSREAVNLDLLHSRTVGFSILVARGLLDSAPPHRNLQG